MMKRVLIVNDQDMTRRLIHLALKQVADVTVVGEANNGWEAINFVQAYQPDVVVMDYRMPHMNGLEATAHITTRWPEIKIIMHSMTGVCAHEGKNAGAVQVLQPYDSMKTLQTAVLNA